MILFADDENPAMRYEGLARAAFDNCDKFGDPWGYAAQDKFRLFIKEPIGIEGKRMLSTVLAQLVRNFADTEYSEKFKTLEQKVWDSTTQLQIIKIIDKSIRVYQQTEQS